MDGLVQPAVLQDVTVFLQIQHQYVTVLVLVHNQTLVYVQQIGREINVQFHNALVFWPTTLPKCAVVEVYARNLIHAYASRDILEQSVKHQFALVFLQTLRMYAMVLVLAHKLIHVFAIPTGKAQHVRFRNVLVC